MQLPIYHFFFFAKGNPRNVIVPITFKLIRKSSYPGTGGAAFKVSSKFPKARFRVKFNENQGALCVAGNLLNIVRRPWNGQVATVSASPILHKFLFRWQCSGTCSHATNMRMDQSSRLFTLFLDVLSIEINLPAFYNAIATRSYSQWFIATIFQRKNALSARGWHLWNKVGTSAGWVSVALETRRKILENYVSFCLYFDLVSEYTICKSLPS